MTLVSSTKLTAEQYMMLGEDPPGVRLELVHGDIIVSPSPSFDHAYTVAKLIHVLLEHVEKHDLGAIFPDVDTLFGARDVRRPDIVFIKKERLPQMSGHAVNITPDLCIEVLSPSTASMDQVDKFGLYAEHGVPFYWMVDPKARTFEAYELVGGEYRTLGMKRGNEVARFAPFVDLEIRLERLWSPVAAS